MTISIELAPELESQIVQAAAKLGLSLDAYILDSVMQRLNPKQAQPQPTQHVALQPRTKQLSKKESDLLQKINQSFSSFGWTRYRELIAKRQAEMLTAQEHAELIALSNQLEEANAKRIGYIAQLADVRQMTLPAMMKELGIKPVPMSKVRVSRRQKEEIKRLAKGCCEYCCSQEEYSPDTFSIEHIIARAKGGSNLVIE